MGTTYDEDPQEYLRQKQKWEQQGTTLNFIDAELEEEDETSDGWISNSKKWAKVIIADKIPEWKDDKMKSWDLEYTRSPALRGTLRFMMANMVALRDTWQHNKTSCSQKAKVYQEELQNQAQLQSQKVILILKSSTKTKAIGQSFWCYKNFWTIN